jgi:anti-sigma B factor antagonist
MRITERRLQGTTVLELHGTLHSPAATELLDTAVRRATRGSPQRLVLDLGDVPSIDAGGLGTLVAAYGLVRRRGGTLGLAHVAARVHALLVVCRLVTVFETFDSVEAAVADHSGASPDPPTTTAPATPLAETSLAVIQDFLERA